MFMICLIIASEFITVLRYTDSLREMDPDLVIFYEAKKHCTKECLYLFVCRSTGVNVFNFLILQAEELFDAASRYLLFPLKRTAADALLPHLETVSPAELCHWLILSDMYVFSRTQVSWNVFDLVSQSIFIIFHRSCVHLLYILQSSQS